MTFVKRPPQTMIPVWGTLVSVRHVATPYLDALQTVHISDKRIWMRIKDPNSERRHVSIQSHRILQLYKKWLSNSAPYMLLSEKGMARTWQQQMHSLQVIFVALGALFVHHPGKPIGSLKDTAGNSLLTWKLTSKVTCKNPSPVWKHWHRLQSSGYLATFIQDIAFQCRFHPFPTTPELSQVAIAFSLLKNLNVGSLKSYVFFQS